MGRGMKFRKILLGLATLFLLSSALLVTFSDTQHVVGDVRYIGHDPIIIDGDTQFLNMAYIEGWPGSGSVNDPYIIGDYEIVASPTTVSTITYGIKISNVSFSFIIEDCHIVSTNYPVFLSNVSNVEVRGNILEDFKNMGIVILDSKFVEVYDNKMTGAVFDPSNNVSPIGVVASRTRNIEVHHNILVRNNGISIANAYPYEPTIENVSVHHNTLDRGDIQGKYVNNISVEYNQLASDVNMWFTYITNLTIAHNTLEGAHTPLDLSYITYLNVNNNTIGFSASYISNDIKVEYSSYIVLENNTLKGTKSTLEMFVRYSENITIRENHMSDGDTGIYMVGGENVEISKNTLQRFTSQAIIMGNTNNTLISHNNMVNNNLGIYLYNVSYTQITENLFYNNSDYGYMQSFSPGTEIFIHRNAFINNHGSNATYNASHVQAYDSVNLTWSWEKKGNYWADWANNNDTNDQNDDGIVDWPYKLDGGGMDEYPLKAISFYIAPLQPENVRAILEAGRVNLTWKRPVYEGSEGVSKYIIYRDGVYLAEVPGDRLWYKDMNVNIGELHTYCVVPSDNYGEGGRSQEIRASVNIRIETDSELSELAINEGLNGDGSAGNPYVIDGYHVDSHGFSDGIYMGNLSRYFLIRNCTVHNASIAGIELYNLSRGRVENSTFYENLRGAYVLHSEGVEIMDGVFRNNRYSGMALVNSQNNTVENSRFSYNGYSGIRLGNASDNLIVGNELTHNGDFGIQLYAGSDGNTITGNRIYENTNYGAYLHDCSGNLVYNNTFYNNHGSGDSYSSFNVQAYDDGGNLWNTTLGGNYWRDWAENNETNDRNNDGVVDWAYELDGDAGIYDEKPLKGVDPLVPELNSIVWVLVPLTAIMLLRYRKNRGRELESLSHHKYQK